MLAIAVTALLIAEMRLPIYTPGTSSLKFENNMIAFDKGFVNAWPGSQTLARQLMSILPRDSAAFEWIWQIISLTSFAALDIVGIIPMVGAFVALNDRRLWLDFSGFMFLTTALVILSLIGAACLAADYDSWSVGGQMLLHINWYLFPLSAVGIWQLLSRLFAVANSKLFMQSASGIILLMATFGWQCVRPPSLLQTSLRRLPIFLDEDEIEAMHFVRTSLPDDTVIFSMPTMDQLSCAYSGIAGRRAYLEYFPSTERQIARGTDTEKSRQHQMAVVWAAKADDDFCQSLPHFVTHVMEASKNPMPVQSPSCLEEQWVSSNGRLRIWKVRR
jgi:hypothetical protein